MTTVRLRWHSFGQLKGARVLNTVLQETGRFFCEGQKQPGTANDQIVLSDAYARFQTLDVLENLCLTFDEKRIGILGRNGSGKTTFVRLIAGLTKPCFGQVSVFGFDPCENRSRAVRSIGVLFQNPEHQIILPTVLEEISFGPIQTGTPKEDAKRKARAILLRYGCQDWESRPTHSLSQGQKQLLCLMAVLVMEPELILLDEPFSGLDLRTKLILEAVFGTLDATIIHVSHDPGAFRNYDRVVWLDHGRVFRDGTAADVASAYTRHMTEVGGRLDFAHL